MADHSKIEWTDATWNPITGCSIASAGCAHCYAMKLAGGRLRHHPSRSGLTVATKAGPIWNGQLRFNEGWLDQPLHWWRGRRIFVCAHGDLFHEAVPDAWIDRVFAVMALARRHTFQVLTKRADRMRAYLTDGSLGPWRRIRAAMALGGTVADSWAWPLPNVWLGVSVESQRWANIRIPALLATPAAVRFLSCEPLLGQLRIDRLDLSDRSIFPLIGRAAVDRADGVRAWRHCARIDQVICGGESGPGARFEDGFEGAAIALRDQCASAGTAFFMKQMVRKAPIPPHLMVREYPKRAVGAALVVANG